MEREEMRAFVERLFRKEVSILKLREESTALAEEALAAFQRELAEKEKGR